MSNSAIVAAQASEFVGDVLNANALRAHVQVVQQVMAAVMKPGVHYGVPFSKKWDRDDGDDSDGLTAAERERRKNVLLKPGAEVLCMTFRIADEYIIETEEMPDRNVAYRVKCLGVHQVSRVVLGEGMGEASTMEEKYRWRKAICQEEFDDAAVDRRRKKYRRGKGGSFFVELQVAESAEDKRNTALKMACKRAKVAMTLNVTAASDMFTQDLDDEIEGEAIERDAGPARKKPGAKKKEEAPAATQKAATPEQNREAAKAKISARLADLKTTVAAACEACKVANFETLTKAEFETLWKYADEIQRAQEGKAHESQAGAATPQASGGGGAGYQTTHVSGPDHVSAQAGGTSTQDFLDQMEAAEKKGSAS